VLLVALFVSPLGAKPSIFKCAGAGGEQVFQDFPCGLGQNAAQQTEAERNRWTIQPKGGCRVLSPLAPFIAKLGEREFELGGGARLELLAAESGIAANVVLNATWPQEIGAVIAADPQPSAAAASAGSSAQALGGANVKLQRRTGAQLLELSGDISGHAIVTATGQRFAVDSMLDPRRMAFGYTQTALMLKTLRSTEFFKFQLLLRAPKLTISSGDLPAKGLREALIALNNCVKTRHAKRGDGQKR